MAQDFPLVRPLLLALTAVLSGCSLTGVADFELGECETDEQCQEALNESHDFYPGCAAFRCVENGERKVCEAMPPGETCDGKDNDCDYLVDEPNDGEVVFQPTTSVLTQVSSTVTSASGFSAAGLSRVYLQSSDALASYDLDTKETLSCEFRRNADELLSPSAPRTGELEPGCWVLGSTGTQSGSCLAKETVTASGSEVGFFAAINGTGCSAGQLRVGSLQSENPEYLVDRGSAFRDPTYRGVTPHDGTGCTNNGQEACTTALAAYDKDGSTDNREAVLTSCGAAAPNLSVLSTEAGDQALVTFLASSSAPTSPRDACGGPVVDVRGLVLFGRTASGSNPFSWVDPTLDGQHESLGQTTGGAPVALQAVGDQGYLLGHADEEGRLRLAFLDAQPPSGSSDGRTCPDAGCDSREGRHTQALTEIIEITSLDSVSGSNVDGVGLSVIALENAQVRVGVTWLEGCTVGEFGGLSGNAYARVVTLSLDGAEPKVISETAPVALGESLDFPRVLGDASGFVSAGLEREGKTVEAGDEGGFFAITRTSSGPRALRLAAFDGAPVEAGELIDLGESRLRVVGSMSAAKPTLISQDRDSKEVSRTILSCQ